MARVVQNPAFVQEWAAENGPRWQAEIGPVGLAAIVDAAPIDTGALKSSGSWLPFFDTEGRPSLRFTMSAEHAEWVDQGTGLFGKYNRLITPKRARLLSWVTPGGERIAVPWTRGMEGRRYFLRGMQTVFARVDEHRYGEP